MKGLVKAAVLTVTLGIGGAFYSSDASAHGYIKEPVSRAYMGALEKQTLGWTTLPRNMAPSLIILSL